MNSQMFYNSYIIRHRENGNGTKSNKYSVPRFDRGQEERIHNSFRNNFATLGHVTRTK